MSNSPRLRIYVNPQRAPRLPRNHFSMRPQVSLTYRVIRALVLGAFVTLVILAFRHH